MTTPMVNMEELEDSLPPVYLRDTPTFRAYMKQRQQRADLERMGIIVKETKKEEAKFKLEEVNYNAWRENILDNKWVHKSWE